MSTLKEYILANVLPENYYAKRFPRWSKINRANQICPWHEDTKPSLSVGLHNGGARCHACDTRLGNIVHFEQERLGIEENAACIQLYSEFLRPLVKEAWFASLQEALDKSPKIQQVLKADCGITRQGIELFALGWDATTNRLAIPIFDRWGNLVNVRLYKPPKFRSKLEDALKVINLKGYGKLDLYSWPHFAEYSLDQPVFVMPSEKECILGVQEGLQCVCATAGENSWEESWNELFIGYDICVVAQRDTVGAEAAQKRLEKLSKVANYACVIEPPTKHKDFADYIILEGGQGLHLLAAFKTAQKQSNTRHDRKIVSSTNGHLNGVSKNPFPSDETTPLLPPNFSDTSVRLIDVGYNVETLNRVIKTTGIVAALSTRPYTIPWRFKVKAKGVNQKLYSIPMGRTLLSFLHSSDNSIRIAIQDLLDNDKASVEAHDYITATEVEVIPTANVSEDVPYVTQRCVYIGTRIEANKPYELSIIPTTDSRTQETVGIIVDAVPIARAVETAVFSADQLTSLQCFKPKGEQSVYAKLLETASELSQHYTKIYQRPDWHLVALLTWLSPIGFKFPHEEQIHRGWLNSLAIGDTETGKSKVVQRLRELFRCGEFVNAENCTYVGLVGGAIKMGSGQFMLRWGRIPLADKQLIVVEELSGLSVEEISNMSDVRSSGIARLDKGGLSSETNARTRLLCLTNVRPVNRHLSGYLSGVRAIQELIGHPEDIARFDLICTLVDREVSNEVINAPFSYLNSKPAIAPELYQRLCQFVWALKPDQIKITTDAYLTCLEETKRLAEIYHPSIPVFKGGSGRYKIARIAAAIACAQFSWNGKSILVLEDHVNAAAELLESLYNKPSFGYLEHSRQMFDRERVKDKSLLDKELKGTIMNQGKRAKVVEALVHMGKFSRDELCAIAGLQFIQADQLIGVMLRERALRKGDANTWEITLAGRDWLQSHL